MQIYTIGSNEAGQRFDKYLFKLFRNAPSGLLYKQLRCKNITLNGSKAKGSEILALNDTVRVYMADNTIAKFITDNDVCKRTKTDPNFLKVIYEDDNIILVDKPVGVLSQKAEPDDVSMNEYLISYLMSRGMPESEFAAFTPAFCNRLDRNTSGIMVGGKSLAGLQQMSEIIKNRSLSKYYIAVVSGRMEGSARIEGWLCKDEKTNKVTVRDREFAGSSIIVTEYEVMESADEFTLLKLKLITGKTHQLRAQLASTGHPILGDSKYGDAALNRKYNVKQQLLHAYEVVFPKMGGAFEQLSGRGFKTPFPDRFGSFVNTDGIMNTEDI